LAIERAAGWPPAWIALDRARVSHLDPAGEFKTVLITPVGDEVARRMKCLTQTLASTRMAEAAGNLR
jgi:hypothetical protein